MPFLERRVNVICGHYGTGKTNLSINLAIDCAREGDDVTLIDMDIVNPYFRSSDYSDELAQKGIRVLGPNFANSNLDTPSLPAAIGDAIRDGQRVIIDVGGDDAGATALGVYSRQLAQADPDVIYVINRYRSQTTAAEEAVDILREIENAAKIKARCIANNSHLKQLTTEETVLESVPFAEEVSRLTGLPVRFTTAPVGVDLLNKIPNMYPISVYVRTPWEKAGN
jgi:MinD-like ATPase involved in chromosome partitioning or flagellar assembly